MALADAVQGAFLRLHQALHERTDGRVGHGMWRLVNDNNRARYEAYQTQTARPILLLVVSPT